jgi:hypothetical protein
MPRYAWHGESLTTDVLGALTSMAYGYVRALAAFKGKTKYATLADAVVGAGGLIAKNYVGNPLAHEMLEALGFSGFNNLGLWAAATMEKQNSIPFWRPESSSMVSAPRYSAAAPVPAFIAPPVATTPPEVTTPIEITSAPAASGASALEI